MPIRYDCHLHSRFSADSDAPAEDMAARAAALGLEGICFTEHMDPGYVSEGLAFTVDFEAYFREMGRLRDLYAGRLRIRAGMEFGLQPHLADTLSALDGQYPFDFIIASQHLAGGRDPYEPAYFEGRSERESYEAYFREEFEDLKAFPAEGWDTLGHLDYVVRYGPEQNRFYSYRDYADFLDPILRLLICQGKCLEVNTGGLKAGLGETNPSADVLRRYRELGGELLTIGSDAHEPQALCYEFGRAADLLLSLGFRYYAVFEERRPRQIRL